MTSKTATIQYKPVTSLVGNNNVLAHYQQYKIVLSAGTVVIAHKLAKKKKNCCSKHYSDLFVILRCIYDVIEILQLSREKFWNLIGAANSRVQKWTVLTRISYQVSYQANSFFVFEWPGYETRQE